MPSLPPPVEQVIADAKRICATPAPTFAERRRGELVREIFSDAGARDADLDEAGNVTCRFGPDTGPATIFAAHLDTVFPADQPIEVVHDEVRGLIRAPGIGDNSLGVAGLVHLARVLAQSTPGNAIVLAATVGEEGLGDLRGAKALLESTECAAFVAVEGSMIDSIKIAGVGSTRLRVTYHGPGGHSWSDRGTTSAIHGLLEAAMRFLGTPAPSGLARNIGTIHGGTSINTIAAQATLEIDLRSEDAATLSAGEEAARTAFENPGAGLTAEIETLGRRPSGAIDVDHPLLVAARRARHAVGLPPAAEGASSTDANAAYGRGVPAITVGLTVGGGAHRVDEYIELPPLERGIAALERLVQEIAQN